MTAATRAVKGGSFLIEERDQSEVFTPENLSEEHRAIGRTAAQFFANEVAPHLEAIQHQEPGVAVGALRKAASLGLTSMSIPEEYGGLAMDLASAMVVAEQIAGDGSYAAWHGAHTGIGTLPIVYFGTEEQKRKYLPKLASGEFIGCWGLTEPGSGSDAGSARMTAVRKGKSWLLNGTKTFITNGHYADVAVIIAVTDRTTGTHGLSAFVVEKGTKGFRPGKKENKLGLRASDTAELIFEDCVIPAENLVGKEGDGFIDAMRVLDGGRISIAALSLGIAQGAFEAALKYSKERKQFGRPISDFQAIQWKLTDMATEIDAARLLTLRAASMKDAGLKTTQESSMAKLYASEVAVRCANEGVQIHGGYGFIKDYPAEKYYRDVKLCTIGEGTSEIQRLVIARQLLKSY